MQFYLAEPNDPVIAAWADTFPDLFTPLDAMPAELREHLRYPEDLFRIQTEAYSKYRLNGDRFFDRIGAWSVAQAPSQNPRAAAAVDGTTAAAVTPPADFAEESGSARFIPYYSMFRAPDQDAASFQLLRPFVGFSLDDARKELSAFMIASSDPATYGELRAYVMPESGTKVDGPATVQSAIDSDSQISAAVSLLDQGGSSVTYGDMQLVPVGDGLLYLRPLYVVSDATRQASLQYIIAVYNGNAAFGTNIQEALAKLFPSFRTDIGDVVGSGAVEEEPGEETPTIDGTVDELLVKAQDLFAQADEALPDFAKYDELNRQARELVQQALELAGAGG